MTTSGLFSWLFKPAAVPEAVWNASTAAVQSQQPSSPEAPSAERTATGQDASHEKSMKLRGGGAGDICCGVQVDPEMMTSDLANGIQLRWPSLL